MATNLDKQSLIDCIWRDLLAHGHDVRRTRCGRYIIINHGVNGYYDDLAFMLREWRRLRA